MAHNQIDKLQSYANFYAGIRSAINNGVLMEFIDTFFEELKVTCPNLTPELVKQAVFHTRREWDL